MSKKKKLKQEVRFLREENEELHDWLTRHKNLTQQAAAAFARIIEIHTPYATMNTPLSDGLIDGRMVLRCKVCKTPEHHTYGPMNDELWPCATLRQFLDPTPFDQMLSERHAP